MQVPLAMRIYVQTTFMYTYKNIGQQTCQQAAGSNSAQQHDAAL
jgi:hypothetical protein